MSGPNFCQNLFLSYKNAQILDRIQILAQTFCFIMKKASTFSGYPNTAPSSFCLMMPLKIRRV